MRTSLFSVSLCFVLWLTASAASSAAPGKHPIAAGTFIQWYLAKDWSDAEWRAEMRRLRDLGMQYLVFAPTLDGTRREAYYPTRIPGCRQPSGCPDLVEACLRNAEKTGIRVYLGLNFHDEWWKRSGNDADWLLAQMAEGNTVADELYHAYHARYPRAFYGWYWVWEVDNLNFQRPEQARTLAKALDASVRHLKALDPRMPVMLCPFMNAACGPPEAYSRTWREVFAQCALGKGDIFCPQDCVGAGGLKLDQVPAWFAALRDAVRTKPGLRFWSDTETFDQTDWTAAPLKRFVAQMRAVQPYVETCITFAYSHYYSPCNAAPGFHQAYARYVSTGRLDGEAPSAPQDVTAVRRADGSMEVRWRPGASADGLCGYAIYRDGVRIARRQAGRDTAAAQLAAPYVDAKAPASGAPRYAVEAYDFVGNASARVEAVTAPGPATP